MKIAYFIATAAAANLCGDWRQTSVGKCSLSNQCCTSEYKNGASIPTCVSPITLASGSIISQETYQFAGDGKYASTLMIATGNSCPLSYDTGTVLFIVATEGTYSSMGNNSDMGNGWEKIVYTPQRFITTITKSNQPSFFTPGQTTQNGLAGPCMKMDDYLNNVDVGCLCNGTWSVASISSGSMNSSATRVIRPANCPMVNSTNGTMMGSCPESYFFNTANRYGNVRMTNTTNNTRMLEITQPILTEAGYTSSSVYATFTANFSCPGTIDSNTKPPTGSPPSSAGALLPLFGVLHAVMFLIH